MSAQLEKAPTVMVATDGLSLSAATMRDLFPGATWTALGRDPVAGKYRHVRCQDGPALARLAQQARTRGYSVTLLAGAR
jgi:hypothetical protein